MSCKRNMLLEEINKKIPGIKDVFENYIIFLKLRDFNESFITTNTNNDKIKGRVVKCHLYLTTFTKIFTLYYNVTFDELYVRKNINPLTNRLNTTDERIYINSIEQLENLLQESVANY